MNMAHSIAKPTVGAILVSAVLSACTLGHDTVSLANKEVAASKAMADPVAALAKLDALLPTLNAALEDCNFFCDSTRELIATVTKERGVRIKQGLDKISSTNLASYYEGAWTTLGDSRTIREALVPRILALADASKGDAPNQKLLRVAGQIVRDGKYVIRDTNKATDYFARAWRAGDRTAAANNASLYQSVHDLNNAYLWALRCMDNCRPDPEDRLSYVDADWLRSQLSTEAIRQAERAALDPSVRALTKG